jgi:hypothetical protein
MTCLFFGRIPLLEWREEDEEEVESLRPNERGDRPHNAKDPSDISGKLDTVADDEVDGLERLGSHMVVLSVIVQVCISARPLAGLEVRRSGVP